MFFGVALSTALLHFHIWHFLLGLLIFQSTSVLLRWCFRSVTDSLIEGLLIFLEYWIRLCDLGWSHLRFDLLHFG